MYQPCRTIMIVVLMIVVCIIHAIHASSVAYDDIHGMLSLDPSIGVHSSDNTHNTIGMDQMQTYRSLVAREAVTTTTSCPCATSPPLPATVKVAILVTCNAPIGILDANPLFSTQCKPDNSPSYQAVAKSFLLGLDMFVSEMLSQQPMPLRDSTNVSWSYTYINVGFIDWNKPDWVAFGKVFGTEQAGLAWNITMTDQFGGPYPFIIPPVAINNTPLTTLINICEDHAACLVLAPFTSAQPMAICTKASTGNGDLPDDCVRRGRLAGSRRFKHMLGVMFDSTAVAVSALDTYHLIGVKSVVIVSEAGFFTNFPDDARVRTEEFAKQLGIKVLATSVLVRCDPSTFIAALNGTNCPSGLRPDGVPVAGQVQILPDGHTPVTYAQWLKDLNPDALVFISAVSGQSLYTFASIFNGLREVDYTPKMINWAGGSDSAIKPYMENYNDLLYTFTTNPWSERLTGPQYRNLKTEANFELFPAEATLDAPAIFAREFTKRYAHLYGDDFDFGSIAFYKTCVLSFQALNMAQKLVEHSLSTNIHALLMSSYQVSVPSVYHQLQFDTTGRTVRVNEVLLQMIPASSDSDSQSGSTDLPHALKVIAPYNIGENPVYPLPTWKERVFNPIMYQDPMEQLMAALTAVGIVICLIVAVGLSVNAKHVVIRAATPSFCLLTILGAVTMLSSNFFHTLVASDSHCAAQIWLLSIGFTLLFSSLFIKTLRVSQIIHRTKLLVVRKMKDRELLLGVAVCVLLGDAVINIVWMATVGMNAMMVVKDSLRPALNLLVCDYSSAMPFVYTHVALKAGLLLGGVALTWMVRGAPTTFNESSYIGICIYNVSLVSCFVLPMLSAHVGGDKYNYLIRAYGILFVCVSTVCILYIPKLLNIYLLTMHSDVGGGIAMIGPEAGKPAARGAPAGLGGHRKANKNNQAQKQLTSPAPGRTIGPAGTDTRSTPPQNSDADGAAVIMNPEDSPEPSYDPAEDSPYGGMQPMHLYRAEIEHGRPSAAMIAEEHDHDREDGGADADGLSLWANDDGTDGNNVRMSQLVSSQDHVHATTSTSTQVGNPVLYPPHPSLHGESINSPTGKREETTQAVRDPNAVRIVFSKDDVNNDSSQYGISLSPDVNDGSGLPHLHPQASTSGSGSGQTTSASGAATSPSEGNSAI